MLYPKGFKYSTYNSVGSFPDIKKVFFLQRPLTALLLSRRRLNNWISPLPARQPGIHMDVHI